MNRLAFHVICAVLAISLAANAVQLFYFTKTHTLAGIVALGVLFIAAALSGFALWRRLNLQNQKLLALKARAKKITQYAHRFVIDRVINLRRPLQGLIGIQDLYADTHNIQEAKDYLEISDYCSRYLVRQLDKVQLFAEIENASFQFEKNRFNLRFCVETATKSACEQAQYKNINQVVIEWSPQIPEHVDGCQVALQKVLIELIDNAVHFAGHEGVRIKVEPDTENPGGIRFSIIDQGPGLPDKWIQLLQTPYKQRERLHPWLEVKDGMGLVLCLKILSKMQASTQAQSQKGVGTGISFSFAPEFLKVAVYHEPELTIKNHIPRVLVVDDDPVTQTILCAYLDKMGAPHQSATNGREAIQLCQYDFFDIILMDLHMPLVDGFEASEAILHKLKIKRRPSIIAISSLCTQADQDRCRRIGILDFLAKPAGYPDLLLSLQSMGYLLEQSAPEHILDNILPVNANSQKQEIVSSRGEYLINFNKLYNSLGEDIKLCHDVLEKAQTSLEDGVQNISSALDRNDRRALAELLHKTRGELALIMCEPGLSLIEKFERCARQDDPAALHLVYDELCAIIDQVALEIEGLIKSHDAAA